MDARERRPCDVGPPCRRRVVAAGNDDETARGELREQRVTQPVIERRQQFVRVDEQHAAGRPSFDHGRQVRVLDAERLAQREQESRRRRLDVAAVDAHHRAAGLVGHARELLEQRGLPHAAGSGDVQHHEGRFVGQQAERKISISASRPTKRLRRAEASRSAIRPLVRSLRHARNPLASRMAARRDRDPREVLATRRQASCAGSDRTLAGVRHRGNEPVPRFAIVSMYCGRPLVVAERTAQVGDRARERRLGNESALPHGVDHLVLRHHAAAGGRQEGQEVHHCGSRCRTVPPSRMRLSVG